MKNLIVGNGVNIQHGGQRFGNQAIILRTMKGFTEPSFPRHIIFGDPILGKHRFGCLFSEARRMISGEDDQLPLSPSLKRELEEFRGRYGRSSSLKMTDIGFEDYLLINDIYCRRSRIVERIRFGMRENLRRSFLHAIYDNGRVNEAYQRFSAKFIEWLQGFNFIYTTNYDSSIELATGRKVHHLHGDFRTRSPLYSPDSFRNQLSDHPYTHFVVDEQYPHLYSTALVDYTGDGKQRRMDAPHLANSGLEKFAAGYVKDSFLRQTIENWKNEPSVAGLREATLRKAQNPGVKIEEPYPVQSFRAITGELVVLGLSPHNDHHLFSIVNSSAVTRCLFYFYAEGDKAIVTALLPDKDVSFVDVRSFWTCEPSSAHR